ncbi:polysaccharide pyruvyl transferase family protein [Microbacterium sp. 1P10UB]|uniref:polysaccharide pyruvyl transferase family protein n=1 Tax=unclassified Microbacterium TaxID=2609290 RepID=UPI00399F4245
MSRGRIVHWNPRKRILPGPLGKILRLGPRVNNFGDLLGPEVVSRSARLLGVDTLANPSNDLLAIGSIMHFARTGATVWGTGVNGKMDPRLHTFSDLDVRAVRGPRTRQFLQQRGIHVPPVFGDPGLLVRRLWRDDELLAHRTESPPVAIVPNLNDLPYFNESDPRVVDPRGPLDEILARIRWSDLVVASSLHGLIVAHSFGVPTVMLRPRSESLFKYEDYFSGVGQDLPALADDAEAAIRMQASPALEWSGDPLLEAFPIDLFSASNPRWGRKEVAT